jgi:hypothetical protein
MFDQEPDNPKYKVSDWTPGNYRFDVYVKLASSRSPKKFPGTTHLINQETIAAVFAGKSFSLADRKISLED